MADNIKIIGNINDIQRISRIKNEDQNLLNTQIVNQTFGYDKDYIELFIYDLNKNLVYSNLDYKNFKSANNFGLDPNGNIPVIEIDPVNDIQSLNYISGEFSSQYNFFKLTSLDSSINLFIQEISDDRTEIRINSADITSNDLIIRGKSIIDSSTNSVEQKSFLLNQSNNTQILIVNAVIDENSQTPSILLKLYEPLPLNVDLKSTVWVTEEIIEPYVFNINLDTSIIPAPIPKLKGPNFDIDIDIKQNLGTKYENYSSLVSSLTGSSYRQVLNYMNDSSYDLNIDYTSFNNFIHFSSAKKRLEIFYSKVKQIEDYNNNINIITGSTNILKNEQTASIKQNIDSVVSKFDGFENYLYYESSSYAWPKITSSKPFLLATTASANTWYNNYTSSANNYDENNLDYLYNIAPAYVKNDPLNYQSYYTFTDMIGHYFDNIWIYITSINELYNADNNLEKGVSKDIVYDALRSLGVKLYNSKGDNEFEDYIGGFNSGSTLFSNDFSATSSYLNNIPKKDLLAETFKRIYHNIPLLSKTKGTSTGLQELITTFGITSSIFSPNEFGGSNKKNQLKGYDNDKITIQNNTITGSVLSPFISLQQPFTSSSDFTSTDLHFVDLSFSPQTELNSRVSASVAITYPTFSIDQYIGDPRLLSSSSYDDLIIQQNYFISASSAISGSAQKLDYKGFIELVKYFDNSLFKMLKDFVPARTNTLTGITIKSPVLERNKVPVYHPKVTQEITYDAKYKGPTITEDKTYYYDKIVDNKATFYTGELTGSYININNVFENSNPNPYLLPTSSIDVNIFNHTDFNIMLNNVSSSVISNSRQKLESLYTSINGQIFLTGSNLFEITSSAELQDSNLSLRGFQNSRYNGTKISSLTYNTYTTSSSAYAGDVSFGKTAVIDRNNVKFGTVKTVNSTNLNFRDKSNIKLKYLVTKDSDLNELNKENKKWFEVQNTFKSGDNLIISLSDPSTDKSGFSGEKTIWQSGYLYNPILYRELNETLYFEYISSIGSYNDKLGVGASTTSSFQYTYLNNQIAIPPNRISAPSTILGQEGSQHQYHWYINNSEQVSTPMAVTMITASDWMHQSIPGLNASTNQMDLTGSAGVTNVTFNNRNYYRVYGFNLLDFSTISYNNESDNSYYQLLENKYYGYKTSRTSTYAISSSLTINLIGNDTGDVDQAGPSVFRLVCVIEKSQTPLIESSWSHVAHTTIKSIQGLTANVANGKLKYNLDQSTIWFDLDMTNNIDITLNVETTASIASGYYVRSRFYWIDLNGAFAPTETNAGANYLNFTLKPNSTFEIYDYLTPATKYITTGSIDQSAPLFTVSTTNITNDTLVFNSSLFNTFLNGSYFLSSSAFGSKYTTPVDLVSLQSQDLVRIGSFDNPGSKYYTVSTSSIISGNYTVVLDSGVDTVLYNSAQNFAFFRKKQDETSIYINNLKNPGNLTSKMYIIPTNLLSSIKDNVGNILQKLDPYIIS